MDNLAACIPLSSLNPKAVPQPTSNSPFFALSLHERVTTCTYVGRVFIGRNVPHTCGAFCSSHIFQRPQLGLQIWVLQLLFTTKVSHGTGSAQLSFQYRRKGEAPLIRFCSDQCLNSVRGTIGRAMPPRPEPQQALCDHIVPVAHLPSSCYASKAFVSACCMTTKMTNPSNHTLMPGMLASAHQPPPPALLSRVFGRYIYFSNVETPIAEQSSSFLGFRFFHVHGSLFHMHERKKNLTPLKKQR